MLECTSKQEMKLRQLSDTTLYEEAKAFIQASGTVKNAQMSGLKNIAEVAVGVSQILEFTRHQANKSRSDSADFYAALTRTLETLINTLKTNPDFIPNNLSKKQLYEYTEFYGVLVAREFIHHLAAENLYQVKE